jgi:hypothetical protein
MKHLGLTILALLVSSDALAEGAGPPPWKHTCVTRTVVPPVDKIATVISQLANKHGQEGWRLVDLELVGNQAIVCFAQPSTPGSTVVRLPPDSPSPDLSGGWSNNDAEAVSKKLIEDCFAKPTWLKAKARRRPSVTVARIINKTMEHIDARTITAKLEAALIATKKARLIRATSGVAPRPADFAIELQLTSILDQAEGRKIRTYQANLSVIGASSGEVACMATAKVKKMVVTDHLTW